MAIMPGPTGPTGPTGPAKPWHDRRWRYPDPLAKVPGALGPRRLRRSDYDDSGSLARSRVARWLWGLVLIGLVIVPALATAYRLWCGC